MITKKQFHYIHELQAVQRAAVASDADVALHSPDGSKTVDAKSYIGMYALDFNEPVLVVSEDAALHRAIADIGDTID